MVAILSACGVKPGAPGGEVATIVAATMAAVQASGGSSDIPVALPGGGATIPEGLASRLLVEIVPAVTAGQEAPPWQYAPEHRVIHLSQYALQDTAQDPEIFDYPAAEYAAMNESAARNIQLLQDLRSNLGVLASSQTLPNVSFFNAAPVFHAQAAVRPFQNGLGIRTLTEYAQYAAPVNNHEMFYHFEGLTMDGKRYIVAILPLTAPLLQADSTLPSLPPSGGVPFPANASPDPTELQGYYSAVQRLLDATPAGDFAPSLAALDAFIGSMSFAP